MLSSFFLARNQATVLRWCSTMSANGLTPKKQPSITNNKHQEIKTVEHSVKSTGSYESVADFYAGKSVFITGGTGFLGKVLIEKLLYSCRNINNIFVLIRDKNGVSVEERLQRMINKPVFTRLIGDRPHDLKKIVPIIGDITQPSLGVSSADEKTLIEKVSVVFHVAATVRFNEPLDEAVNINLKGTEHVVNLCQQIKNIKAFVHVSTAYCNTEHKVLQEKVYSRRADHSEVLKYVRQPYKNTEYNEKRFLRGSPNTYTFTKSLAENYVDEHCTSIPTVIIRPSIISPARREPLAGFTDSWFGGPGLLFSSVMGVNRVVLGTASNILDVIPVDYVSNAAIVAASKCSSSNSVTVYNCCTSSCNPVSIIELYNGVRKNALESGLVASPNKRLILTNNKLSLRTRTFLLQIIPAYIADIYRWAIGKKPKYVKLQSIMIFGRDLIGYFSSRSWEMKADNVKSLHAGLTNSDKNTFPCDPSDINWDEYTAVFLNYAPRSRRHATKV